EALAASVLADQAAAAPAAAPQTIEFTCPQCDELVQLPADVAGKQAPCPKCRNIVRVPQPTKQAKKDWRDAGPRGPAAARQDLEQPALDGVLGPTTATAVSTQALREAGVIREAREPWTWKQRITWIGGPVAVALALLYAGYWVAVRWGDRSESAAV